MKKPKKTSMQFVRGPALVRPSFDDPYGSQETLEHLKNCEAREWITRHKRKIGEVGYAAARSWWTTVCDDIEKRRGLPALDDLRNRMNKEKANV